MTEEHLFSTGKQFRSIELKASTTKGSLTRRVKEYVRARFDCMQRRKEGRKQERKG